MTFKTPSRLKLAGLAAGRAVRPLPLLHRVRRRARRDGGAAAGCRAAAAEPTVNKGDTAWMLSATVLVLLMTIPGLALFYGGLVRTKNMLSVLM